MQEKNKMATACALAALSSVSRRFTLQAYTNNVSVNIFCHVMRKVVVSKAG